MSEESSKGVAESGHAAGTPSGAEAAGSKKALNRRDYLKAAAVGVAGAGAAAIGMPTIAKAQNKTWKLKLQSNWTGIGIESQDRAAKLFVERVNKMSGGRIEMTNFNAEVLLGIGETFRGVGSGVADSRSPRPSTTVASYRWASTFGRYRSFRSRTSSSTSTSISSWASRSCGARRTSRTA